MTAHVPVLINETLNYLAPESGKTYVDCTFGAGGYSRAILEKANIKLYAIDCDPDVLPFFECLKGKKNAHFIHGNFCNLESLLKAFGVTKVDGIVLDLGVSSMQLDEAARGFSFGKEAQLDMRMSKSGYSAHQFINEASETKLADVIYHYGDETNARQIAKNIIAIRTNHPINTTIELAEVVRNTFKHRRGKIDLATKTFQAIRIFINNELENLKAALLAAERLLIEHGRLVVVTFHSLEDRIVKRFIQERSNVPPHHSRYKPDENVSFSPTFKALTKKAIAPSEDEVKYNPRARSAKLRAAERIYNNA